MPHKKIKHLRLIRNYTQHYMANRLKMSDSNYSRLENGKVAIDAEKLNEIAAVLDVIRFELIYQTKEELENDIKRYLHIDKLPDK